MSCLIKPESVSVKPETSENAGVHRWLHHFKPATSSELGRDIDSTNKLETEAFRASEGLNASRIQVIEFS